MESGNEPETRDRKMADPRLEQGTEKSVSESQTMAPGKKKKK